MGQAQHDDTGYRVRQNHERLLAPGEIVFEAEEEGSQLYVVQAGQVELVRESPSGRRVVAQLGPGDFFGELALVRGEAHGVRARAVGEARVLEVDRETLEAMCLARPEIGLRLVRCLVDRLADAERRLAGQGGHALRPLLGALCRAARRRPGGGHQVETTLRALAGDAGVAMRDAHRGLNHLLERKLLLLQDDVVVVPDLEALAGALDAPD